MTLDGTPLNKNNIHLCGYYVGHAHHTALLTTAAAQEREHP
jgi:hypothetical protein